MPRLSLPQQEARRQIQWELQRGLPLTTLGPQVFEILSEVVPHDGGFISMLDPATLLYSRLISATPNALQNAKHFLEETYLHDPASDLLQPSQLRANLPLIALFPQIEKWMGLPVPLQIKIAEDKRCQEFYAATIPNGGVIRMGLKAGQQWVAGLEIVREEAYKRFRPTEIVFLHTVASEIATGLHHALQQETLKAVPSTVAPDIGILVIDFSGREQFINHIAKHWLSVLYSLQSNASGKLPIPIMVLMASLQYTEKSATVSALVIETPFGRIRLELTANYEHNTIAIAFVPVRPNSSAQIPEQWLLTKRETIVVQLLLQGCSNRQISDALFVTINTVQTHLQNIYEKVGVKSRSQLIAAYFSAVFK